jgi:hypothetical protein
VFACAIVAFIPSVPGEPKTDAFSAVMFRQFDQRTIHTFTKQ